MVRRHPTAFCGIRVFAIGEPMMKDLTEDSRKTSRVYLRWNFCIQMVVLTIFGPLDLGDFFLFKVSAPAFVVYWVFCYAVLHYHSGQVPQIEQMLIKWGSCIVVAIAVAAASLRDIV